MRVKRSVFAMANDRGQLRTVYEWPSRWHDKLRRRMQRKIIPTIKEPLLRMSTYQARRKIDSRFPIKILVDNTVLGIAIAHETRWITTSIQEIGGNPVPSGFQARVPVYGPNNRSKEFREAKALVPLSYLNDQGFVQLYTSAELSDERFRQPIGRFRGYGMFDHSILNGVERNSIDGHVFPTLGPRRMNLPTAEEQQRARIRDSGDDLFERLFAVLRHQLGDKCQDVWHLRTAEVTDCYCFLTTDGPLLKAWKSLRHKSPLSELKTKILSPSELADDLELVSLDPVLLSFDGCDAWLLCMNSLPR